MNRSGIVQIAFDHNRYGQKNVKQEPGGSDAEDDADRWITEQRLNVDHPDFFCGQGALPPRGIDDRRPRGAWYLHQGAAVVQPVSEQQQEQQHSQPASAPASSPPMACDPNPQNFRSGGGGQSSSSSSSSSSSTGSPAFPQPHVAWGPSSDGDDGEDLGSSAVAAPALASADATDSAQQERDADDLLGV